MDLGAFVVEARRLMYNHRKWEEKQYDLAEQGKMNFELYLNQRDWRTAGELTKLRELVGEFVESEGFCGAWVTDHEHTKEDCKDY